MSNGLELIVCSDIDYEHVFVQISYEDKFVALISQEEGPDKLKIEFTEGGKAGETPIKIDLLEFEKALATAKANLIG